MLQQWICLQQQHEKYSWGRELSAIRLTGDAKHTPFTACDTVYTRVYMYLNILFTPIHGEEKTERNNNKKNKKKITSSCSVQFFKFM